MKSKFPTTKKTKRAHEIPTIEGELKKYKEKKIQRKGR
jgi:hypothetical protein